VKRKDAIASGKTFLCHASISRIDVSNRSIDFRGPSNQTGKERVGGDSPPTVAAHRWVVAVRGWGREEEEEKEEVEEESAPGTLD